MSSPKNPSRTPVVRLKRNSSIPFTTKPNDLHCKDELNDKMMKESCRQRVVRKSTNSWLRLVGLYQKSGKVAKAKVKQVQLENRKKRFGVSYMDMVLSKNSEDKDLQNYASSSREEILTLQGDINLLKTEARGIDERTKRKLIRKKLKPNNSSPPDQSTQGGPSAPLDSSSLKKQSEDDDSKELPPGWKQVVDGYSGEIYYYNQESNMTSWEKPGLEMMKEKEELTGCSADEEVPKPSNANQRDSSASADGSELHPANTGLAATESEFVIVESKGPSAPPACLDEN